MSNIILKLKLDFPNNHTDNLDELHKLIDSISNTVSNDTLIHKMNILCNFKKVISISEDDARSLLYSMETLSPPPEMRR